MLWHRLLSPYELAVSELLVKLNHLRKEYHQAGRYCPVEHVVGRVKSISSILEKMKKKSIPFEKMEEEVEDIAGIRIICQFIEDIDKVADHLKERRDMTVVEIKDYIKKHKSSGYRSYHMVVRYPVNTIDGRKEVLVEIQIRTLAMDFWATTEHSLQYKYQGNIPERISQRLSNAANAIIALDGEMSSVREEIMDAQMSSRIRYNMIEDIVNTLETLYRVTAKREVQKLQDEFFRIYSSDDMEKLTRFYHQLDLLAEGYKAQTNKIGEGIKDFEGS